MKLTDAESRSLTEVLKENTRLAAELAQTEAQLGRSGSARIAMLAYAVEQLSAVLRRARPYVLNHDCADAAELEAMGLTMRAIDQALGSELETSAQRTGKSE